MRGKVTSSQVPSLYLLPFALSATQSGPNVHSCQDNPLPTQGLASTEAFLQDGSSPLLSSPPISSAPARQMGNRQDQVTPLAQVMSL